MSESHQLEVDAKKKVAQALRDRAPFHSGICTVPDYQLSLYYSQDDTTHRRLDFSKAGEEEPEALYQTCKPATFGRNGENILDETYRKAGKMDLTAFSAPFDPRSLGIHDQISQGLFTRERGVEMELYKLNIYGKGDFFKPHKDTPRGVGMVGSLVVVLPTKHEGGQLVLRKDSKEWTIDFADKFAAATEPSICFVAFFGDVEHEVLPVTSGYRVTLTYNLYYTTPHATSSYFPSPAHQQLKEALVELVNDKTQLPNGGYLGFGLQHEYACNGRDFTGSFVDQLKGPDQILADVCDELDLPRSLKLLYKNLCDGVFDLLTAKKLRVDGGWCAEDEEILRDALHKVRTNDAEVVEILGRRQVGFHE
ncbi:hypothetical protein PAXINDRAFT_128457, partial [Paxillus involutus ATCC 200175]